MIKTYKQATEVQDRRADSGKRGYAKAVRRFLLREFPDGPMYQSRRGELTAVWPKNKKVKKKCKSKETKNHINLPWVAAV